MATLNLLLFGLVVWLVPASLGKGSFTPLREQLKVLERELQKMRALVPGGIKPEFSWSFDQENALSALVQKSVTTTIAGMLKDKSIEGIISGQVRAEIKSLKGMVHRLKGLVRSLTQRVTQAEIEREVIRNSLEKQRKMFNERVDALEQSLNRSQEAFMNVKTFKAVLEKDLLAGSQPKTDKHMTGITQRLHVSSVTVTTPSSKPQVAPNETARILVVPFSKTAAIANQIHLNNKSVQVYPFITLKEVTSVVYLSREKTIYASTRNPRRIVSYRLDRPGMTTVQPTMASSGMAVHKRTRHVYFTTYHPHYTVSRMVRGRYVRRLVDLTNCGGYPHSIAVDISYMIYVACDSALVEMNSFGRIFRNVHRGSHIYAVSLDPEKRVLYFNNDTQVMQIQLMQRPGIRHQVRRAIAFYPSGTMALRSNKAPDMYLRKVFELTYIPRNFVLYKSRIYIGSQLGGHVDLLHVDGFSFNTVLHELQKLQTETVNIALIS